MAERQVDKIVFSSSAAVFGTPDRRSGHRGQRRRGRNPRTGSRSSSASGCCATRLAPPTLAHTSLRYFNVVGSGYPDLRDTSPHNLFPMVFEQLVAGKTPYINGDDYPTPGRDLRPRLHPRLRSGGLPRRRGPGARPRAGTLEPVYNLGSGTGLSVREIMEAVARVTKIDFTPEIHPRRPGDPAQIVATGELARRDLAWQMRHTVDQMVASAWEARQAAQRRPEPSRRRRGLRSRSRKGQETRPSHQRAANCHVPVTDRAFRATQILQSSA